MVDVGPDFLLPDGFRHGVRRECLKLTNGGGPVFGQFGAGKVEKLLLANAGTSQLWRLLADQTGSGLPLAVSERRATGREEKNCAQLEQIAQIPAICSKMQSRSCAGDIFFTSHKAWFYLSDVRRESGASRLRENGLIG